MKKTTGEIDVKDLAPKVPPLRTKILNLLSANKRKRQSVSLIDLSNLAECSPKQAEAEVSAIKESGYNIEYDPEQKMELSSIIPKQQNLKLNTEDYFGDDWVRFGFITDTHLASKYSRLDVLNAIYDVYEKEGITTVYHGGNWIDGDARFNKYDVHCIGFEAQLEYFLKHYPQRKGMTTHIVSGDDHEGWYVQREQINVGRVMQERAASIGRDDIKDLGYMERDLEFRRGSGKSIIRIIHAGGGSAYAISYTSQKYVESLQGGEKPAMVLIGHFHKFDWSYPREVHTIQGGCFTGNTNITTQSGQKRIKDIRVGDLVLTHKNRYRPVSAIMEPRMASDFWAMNYGRKNRPDQTLTATSEHPVLVGCDGFSRAWVKMSEVKPGDWVFVRATKCRVSGDPIPFWLKMSKMSNPMDEKSTRDKLSATKGPRDLVRSNGDGWKHLMDDILPYCERMKAEGWTVVPVGNSVTPDIIGFKDGRVVAVEVESSGGRMLEFKKGKYEHAKILDFVDEVRWVDTRIRKEQPRAEYEPDESGFIKVKVLSCAPVKARKQRTQETVYNFSVEEDESYLAGSVVVHNCTMDQSPFMRKKRIQAMVGGCIVEAKQDRKGIFNRVRVEWMPFYGKRFYQYHWGSKL